MFENQSELTLLDKENSKRLDNFNLNLSSLFSSPLANKDCAIVVSNGANPDEGIDVGSLLEIDFTKNTIEHEGLYVITIDDKWIGYRRFQLIPDLRIVSGSEVTRITPEIMKSIKVVGLVKDIYRSLRAH